MFSYHSQPENKLTPLKMRTPKRRNFTGQSDDLIEVVNQLQNKLAASGHTLDVSLPQIVVVGCQSAGKSSVLESIVGREFLPRGSGVVTRRPTVVQLQPSEEEYAVFLHKPDRIYENFQEVKAEIAEETNRIPGPVGFSSVPISLKIYSPKVLKLTLCDLPGLIRVTVGNQSESSINEVRDMVLEYIRQPNSLILAVSPANQDISNSDALEIAKTVDPERVRTIGVLTKLDLMDEGTNARDILENKKIPLKRGYVGILNRSQKDIDDGHDIEYSLEKEKKFFDSSPSYKHMADRMGTTFLKKTLNQQLYAHIKEYLPSVRKELTQKLSALHKELKDFQTKTGFNLNDSYGIQSFISKLVQEFIEHFQIEIFGYSDNVSMGELSAGVMINFTLYKNVQNNLKLPSVPSETELITIIANLNGLRNSFSMPSLAMEVLNKQLLKRYIEPLKHLVDVVADILVSTVQKTSKLVDHYPNLQNEMLFLMGNSIDSATFDTKETLEKHMLAEMYFVNIYHPDFSFPQLKSEELFPMNMWNDLSEKTNASLQYNAACFSSAPYDSNCGINCADSDEKEAFEKIESNGTVKSNAYILAETVKKYLLLQQKHIGDIAVKYILFFLVKRVMDFVKSGLVPTILDSTIVESILQDCNEDIMRMKDMESTCECLEDALSYIQNF